MSDPNIKHSYSFSLGSPQLFIYKHTKGLIKPVSRHCLILINMLSDIPDLNVKGYLAIEKELFNINPGYPVLKVKYVITKLIPPLPVILLKRLNSNILFHNPQSYNTRII